MSKRVQKKKLNKKKLQLVVRRSAVVLVNILLVAGIAAACCLAAVWIVNRTDSYGTCMEIYDAEDYREFMEQDTKYWSGARGILMADIYLDDTSIAEKQNFQGELDGNGHSIYGLYSEHGYGLAEYNFGVIQNLTIENSLICGGEEAAGICRENFGTIKNCGFGGKIAVGKENCIFVRSAGICVGNYGDGIIEGCGYFGELLPVDPAAYAEHAGICLTNSGEVKNCYNTAILEGSGEERIYAIGAFEGENCYMCKDSQWEKQLGENVIELDREELLQLPSYLAQDWYSLYLEQQQASEVCNIRDASKCLRRVEDSAKVKEVLQDEVVVGLVPQMMAQYETGFGGLEIKALEPPQDTSMRVRFDCDGTWMEVIRYEVKRDVVLDFHRLWEECADILGRDAYEKWEHRSFQLQAEYSFDDEKLVLYCDDRENGVFYICENQLYHFVFGEGTCFGGLEKAEENLGYIVNDNLSYMQKGRDRMGVAVFKALSYEKCFTEGIKWQDEELKKRVYACAELEDEEAPVAIEDIMAIQGLSLYDLKLDNLDFLNWMPNLKWLTMDNCGLTDISKVKTLKNLETLNARGNKIWDLSPLEACTKLTCLDLTENAITKVEPLKELTQLKELNLENNLITDFTPLYHLENLEIFRFVNNPGKEIGGELLKVPGLRIYGDEDDIELTTKLEQMLGWLGGLEEEDTYFQINSASAGDVNKDGFEDVAFVYETYEIEETEEAKLYHTKDKTVWLILGAAPQEETVWIEAKTDGLPIEEKDSNWCVKLSGNYLLLRGWDEVNYIYDYAEGQLFIE